jgi:hypothetical protein
VHGGQLVEELRLEELQAGWNSSARIISASTPPDSSMVNENHRYSVPMSLWLVANSQRAGRADGRARGRDRGVIQSASAHL